MQDTQQLQSAISTFPLPLAQALRRAVNAKSPQEQHNGAYYFFESSLKLAASAQLGVYFSLGCPHAPLNQLIENLTRPSVGHWLALLRETAAYLAGRQDTALLPLPGIHDRLTRKQPMPAVKAFLEFAARVSDKQEGRQAFRVLDYFDAVVAYRNQELGHGAMRERAFYTEAAPLLLEAALEAVNALRPVGDLQFVVARDVIDPRTQKASRRFDVLRGDGLHLPLETSHPKDPEILAGRLLLAAGNARVPLHPLLVYEIDKLDRDRVGFLNHVASQGRGDTQKLKRVEYLDYDSGDRLEGHDALSELAALLSKVRGQAVSIEAVAALSQGGTEIHVGAAPSDKGQFIGDFELVEELGRGGMGIVYKARQNSLRRIVALKVLPPALAGDPVSVARFKREIAALGRCDHPNVVKVLTAGQDGERHFYAMEYVEGSDLAQVCGVLSRWKTGQLKEGHILKAITDSRAQRSPGAKTGQAPLPEVPKAAEIVPEISEGRDYFTRLAEILGDAASGVQHLHEHGIIHRDLKPANIMLTQDGKRAVIMDLGLAQLQDRSLSLTASSVKILGTLRYMPPEQLQHQMLEVTPKADIYSLGATLYELAALAPMFDGDTEARLMQQVLQEEPKSPRSRNASVPRDLETIITVAAAKAPNDRYATAGALAQDLRAFSRGDAISARAPSTFHYLKLFYRKNKALVGGLAAAVAVMLALTAWFIASLDESRADAERSAVLAREKEAQAVSEAERANKAEQDAKDKALAAQKAREEADKQRGVAEAKTLEVQAALKEAARNLQQIHMEKGQAAAERGEVALALNHFAQAAKMAEDLGDRERFNKAWEAFCELEPRQPLELWSTPVTGFAFAKENIAFNRDGSIMAGHVLHNVSCIETATGRLLCSFAAPTVPNMLWMSPDGSRLVMNDWDSAHLWDARLGRQISVLDGFSGGALGVAFAEDGLMFLALNKLGHCVTIDCASGKQIAKRETGIPTSYGAFSPDGRHFMLLGKEKMLSVFETETLTCIKKFDCGYAWPMAMALAPGGVKAALRGEKNRLLVWDVADAAKVADLEAVGVYGRSLAFSPKGRLAVALSGGEVWLFDNGWQTPRVLTRTAKLARSLHFLPHEDVLAVGRFGGGTRLLDLDSGKELLEAPGPGADVCCLAQSPDGRCVAVGTLDFNIVLLDAGNGRVVRKLTAPDISPLHICFLPDSRTLACGGMRDAAPVLVDVETGEVVRQFGKLDSDESTVGLVTSPDGRFLFVATNKARVRRYSVSGDLPPRVFALPPKDDLVFSPELLRVTSDGHALVVADYNGQVVWISSVDGALLKRDTGDNARMKLLALSPDGKRIAVARGRDKIEVREFGGKSADFTIDNTIDDVTCTFTQEGLLLWIDVKKRVRVFDAETRQIRTLLTDVSEQPQIALVTRGGRALLVSKASGQVVHYALQPARKMEVPRLTSGDIFELCWIPATSLLAVGSGSTTIKLVDMVAGRLFAEFGGTAEARVGFFVSPDGNTLICGGMARQVVAYDIPTGAARDLLPLAEKQINFGGDFSPDGRTLCLSVISQGEEMSSSLVFVNLADGARLRELKLAKGAAVCVRYLDGGKSIFVAGVDMPPTVIDANTGAMLREFGTPGEQTLACDVNGARTLFVMPGADHSLKLYNLVNGAELGAFVGHSERPRRCCFSPNGQCIASIGTDGSVLVWDVATRRELGRAESKSNADITGLCFSPDSRFLLFVNRDSEIVPWDFNNKAVLKSAEGVDARSIVALARHITQSRLEGFELEPMPPSCAPVRWLTQDQAPPLPRVPGVELPREELLSEGLAARLSEIKAGLLDWLVQKPIEAWRQKLRGRRYIEESGKDGKKVRKAVAAEAPWERQHFVDFAGWWCEDKYGTQAASMLEIEAAEQNEDWRSVARSARALLETAPRDPWLLFRAGRAAWKLRDWRDAESYFTDYLKLDPQCLYALAGAAVARSYTPHLSIEETKANLDTVIAAGIRTAEVYVARARVKSHLKDVAGALADCEAALKLDPLYPEGVALKAELLASTANVEEAAACFDKAVELDPQNCYLRLRRAAFRRKIGKTAQAVEDYTACINLLQKDLNADAAWLLHRAYGERGDIFAEQGEVDKAIEDYTAAIRWSEDGSHISFNFKRGILYLKKEMWTEAFKDFDICVNWDSHDLEATLGRARAAEKLGDLEFAAADYVSCSDSDRDSATMAAEAAAALSALAQGYEDGSLVFPCYPDWERALREQAFKSLSAEARAAKAKACLNDAFARLQLLVAKGYRDAVALERDPRLARARKDPRWAEVIKAIKANK